MKKIFVLMALASLTLVSCHKKAWYENDGIPVIPADPPVIVYEDSGNLVTGTGTDQVELNSTFAWKAEGNAITVDIQFDLAEYIKNGGWELGYFMWDLASINDFLGFSIIGDTTEDNFYGVNPDGSNAGLTSYKPGMWINQDGTASGSGGLNYWQWYLWTGRENIYYDYGGGTDTAFNGLFLIGGNPSNIAAKQAELIGTTVTSKAKIKDFDLTVNLHYYLSEKSAEGAGKLVQFQEDGKGNVSEVETLSSYTYKIGENSADINVVVNTEEWTESGSWEIGHFKLDRAQFKDVTGIDPAELDETTFYAVDDFGDPLEQMTSYKPGMWVDENGLPAAGWSPGVVYWQWYVWGGKPSVDEKGEPYTISYDYDYEKYPDTFIVGGNTGNKSKITFEQPFSTFVYMQGADKEYTMTITYTFKEQILPETEGYPEAVFEGTGTSYPYGGGVDGDHTIQWYFDEEGLTVDVDAYVPTIQANGDWIFTAATIPTEVMAGYLGVDIEQLFDTSYFYPLNADGAASGSWTCDNTPGQWVKADGSAAGWSDGVMYWWYQWGDHKYEGHFTEGLFLVGTNPGNVETVAGQTVTSKAQLGDKILTVNVHYYAEYPTAKTGKVGPFDYSWTMADGAFDVVSNVSIAQADASWAWMGFFINEKYVNEAFGVDIDALAAEKDADGNYTGFYPLDGAGNQLAGWTSYIPGQWFLENGDAGDYKTGVSFWQYFTSNYAEIDPRHEFTAPNFFYVGKNPGYDFKPGTYVSKAKFAGNDFTFTINIAE